MGAADLLKSFGNAVVSDARKSLQEVVIESALIPPIRIDLRPTSGSGGAPKTTVGGKEKKGGLLSLVRPYVSVKTTFGDMAIAPAGRPQNPGALYPVVLGVGAGVVALAVLGVVSIAGSGRRGAIGLAAIAAGSYGIYRWQKARMNQGLTAPG